MGYDLGGHLSDRGSRRGRAGEVEPDGQEQAGGEGGEAHSDGPAVNAARRRGHQAAHGELAQQLTDEGVPEGMIGDRRRDQSVGALEGLALGAALAAGLQVDANPDELLGPEPRVQISGCLLYTSPSPRDA